ncbi:hypothetical protein ZHAS_00004074 [Anopheles sinensis]|uniref:Uncharacterized protein n=1 Tax=Anopheles sinensis TaxID=74873 RepID=A0A084VFY6_ANOSI|nr:hypothetical protein ZHAS_00004074 [Anopheles sinensis]
MGRTLVGTTTSAHGSAVCRAHHRPSVITHTARTADRTPPSWLCGVFAVPRIARGGENGCSAGSRTPGDTHTRSHSRPLESASFNVLRDLYRAGSG